MSSKETQHLTHLLTTFHATSLGEGDTNAGANVLAAMAVTLANLAPADGSVVLPDGKPARLGTSLLISGSGSCGRVGDEIITEVGRRQANLATRLRGYCNAMEERAGKPSLVSPPTGPGADTADELLSTALSDIEPLYGTTSQAWGRIMEESPAGQVRDLADKPKFLVCAARPKDLEAQLVGLRPGRPLIHLGINRPADFAELADPGTSLVGGYYSIGDGCELVRGNMIISDPLRLLNEAAKAPDERTMWLGHFLWLTDSDAGPDVPEDVTQATAGSGGSIIECFQLALGNVMARRLSLHKGKPLPLCHDTRVAAHRWTEFLREMEQRLPGIYGAARNLLNTLVFGLGELAKVGKGLRFPLKGVEAFARFLVRRAVNARTAICLAADVARRQSQIERIFRKLPEGWQNERKIYGNLSIPAADCRWCLLWLQDAGIAQRSERLRKSGSPESIWNLVEGAQLNFADCRLPLLEV
jgi:hypothetical protein